MEERIEKPNDNVTSGPSKSAYLWLAGIFGIVFAVIYIALVVFIRFAPNEEGILNLSITAANTLYVCILLFFLVALYLYIVISRRELLSVMKRAGALMTAFTFVVVLNIMLVYFNPYLMCVALTAMLALPFSKKRDAFILNTFACLISSFTLLITLDYTEFPAVTFTLIAGMLGGAVATYTFPAGMT
ncbi:MAG: hypothetical protein K2L51_05860, partial [Clostridiales bacterium]|nr:hypothetical protein [Clostridiales bacterium]